VLGVSGEWRVESGDWLEKNQDHKGPGKILARQSHIRFFVII